MLIYMKLYLHAGEQYESMKIGKTRNRVETERNVLAQFRVPQSPAVLVYINTHHTQNI
jgi:hypothetical protein